MSIIVFDTVAKLLTNQPNHPKKENEMKNCPALPQGLKPQAASANHQSLFLPSQSTSPKTNNNTIGGCHKTVQKQIFLFLYF